jgi:hypothetical protein
MSFLRWLKADWIWALAVTVIVLFALSRLAYIQDAVGVHTVATPSPQVAKLETTTVQPKSVVVYEPKAKHKLGLDADTVANPSKHVLASSKVKANVRPSTITTVLDESTGQSATLVRVDPYPWLGANPSGSLSLSYGIRSGDPVVRLVVTQDVLQIKALHLTGIGTLDSDGQYYAGAGVTYKW